jgi:hypothetical protein
MVQTLSVLAAAVITAVFVMSGLLKLGRSDETLKAMGGLRVPTLMRTRWIARAVPVVELCLAAGLLAAPAPLFTGVALFAAALLAAFLVLTIGAVARREAVVCNCFGGVSSRPIGGWTIARNAALVVLSVAAVTGSAEGAVPAATGFGLGDWTVFLAAASVLLVVATAVLVLRLQRGAESPARPTGPGRNGAEWPVPDLEVTDAWGRAVELVSLAEQRPVLLLLLSAECTPCVAVADSVGRWRDDFGSAVEIAVLTSASPTAIRERYPELGAPVFYGYRSLMVAAGIEGTPSALLLGTNRMVAAGPAQGLDDVNDLAAAIASVVPSGQPPSR